MILLKVKTQKKRADIDKKKGDKIENIKQSITLKKIK
jgi:hypothetical protein